MKIKRIITILSALLVAVVPLSFAVSGQEIPDERQLPRLVDRAELLDTDEADGLLTLLDRLSDEVQCDIAVVTVKSLDGKSVVDYTDDFYDYNGYGYGEDRDGIMLLINMGERDVHISDCGYVCRALSQKQLDRLREQVTPYLSSGDYYTAFRTFADRSAQLITDARNGGDDEPSVDDHSFEGFFRNLGNIPLICIVVGVIGGFTDYVRNGSFNITNSSDIFLYTTVSKTARPKDDDSSRGGGGGGGHVSSSGTSHGGSSGKF
ncbi:MAG: hypothetical protein BHW37_07100 [Firmicutes bacterium CAG:272_52_7]|nr:MAG: hypothetical protein BHW37_07100 [Firmicutes bacterium CAG:272_52_7]